MVKPNWVIAYGKCAIENVDYFSNNDVFSEFSKEIKFDVFVPGCPPRPEAFIYSVLRLIEKPQFIKYMCTSQRVIFMVIEIIGDNVAKEISKY